MPREGWWHSRTGQTGPNTSLVGSRPALLGEDEEQVDPGSSKSFGIFPGQKNHPRTKSCPGYGGAEGCSSDSWNVLSGDGPTGIIKSNPGPADIPKSHPALEGVVQTLLELWEPLPGADPFPSWRGGISLSLPVPAPFSLWHNKIRLTTGNSTPV